MTENNQFYFNCTDSNTLLSNDNLFSHPQQEIDYLSGPNDGLVPQPPLLLDSSSSCQSSPYLLYETMQQKKQPKKKTIHSELKRQIHIQSEQKRRAQIKDGFDELKNELPSCLNKKISKVALLHRTVQHIQHLKNTQLTILAELECLAAENNRLKKFKESALQAQTMHPL